MENMGIIQLPFREATRVSATINDIAKRCGQPAHIVGRVLNDCADISREIRAQVIEAAEALGYPLENDGKPFRTHNLGVLFVDESTSGITHPFFASMLNAFKEEAENRGYDITFINHKMGLEHATYLEHCRYRHVDGVCLACVDFRNDEVQALLDSEIPCVAIDHTTSRHTCVLSDNHDGVRQLTEYAISMGHERIAFIHGQRNSQVTEDRIKQFIETMRAHGCDLPDGYIVEGRYGDADVVRALVEKLLALSERPTCILLPDDSTYFAAQEVIRAHELRIPSDISVAGYDGVALMQSLRPQLTTIQQNGVTMGREAAMRLVERVEHPQTAAIEVVNIPVTLLKGGTMAWCNDW